ncbi:MAG: MCE family protein [Rhodospirillales bacterium]|nr:MCE family protein [Rhodospirillales bacterium]
MNSDHRAEADTAPPLARTPSKRRFSLIWLIPIVAAVAGLWLVYTTFAERGPLITIIMQQAAGIEPGKTPIRYRDVQLGVVQSVTLSDDLQHVVVSARMEKSAENELRTGTEFWVENARITAGGVSGLSTLLSGAYIGMRPGTGEEAREFIALETAPVYEVDVPGKQFVLHAQQLGSVSPGSPIYFRGIEVGSVLGYQLDEDGSDVSIFAFVRSPYDAFVRQNSHFWNASGIDVSVSTSGVNVRTESLQSIIAGGVAFDTSRDASAASPAEPGSSFALYEDFAAVEQAKYKLRVPLRLYFDASVSGLEPGAPVVAMGIRLGEVTDVRLQVSTKDFSVRIPVMIYLEPQRWMTLSSESPSIDDVRARLSAWIDHGLRAQLDSGNLITGQKVISLVVAPNAAPAHLTEENGVLVMPTIPSQIEVLSEKASAFFDKLEKAPVAELVADLRKTVQQADNLLSSPSVRQGVEGLRDVGPLLNSLTQTSNAARLTLDQTMNAVKSASETIGPDSAVRYDLARLLKELTSTARSLRSLSDFIENNPNALILGKPAPDQP